MVSSSTISISVFLSVLIKFKSLLIVKIFTCSDVILVLNDSCISLLLLSNDKKVNNEKINFVLLEEIEKPILKEVDIEQAMELIIND